MHAIGAHDQRRGRLMPVFEPERRERPRFARALALHGGEIMAPSYMRAYGEERLGLAVGEHGTGLRGGDGIGLSPLGEGCTGA